MGGEYLCVGCTVALLVGDPILPVSFYFSFIPLLMNPAAVVAGVQAAKEAVNLVRNVRREIAGLRVKPKARPKAQPKAKSSVARAPAAIGVTTSARIPSHLNAFNVAKNEFLASYSSTGTSLNTQVVHLQPGDASVFQYLAPVAKRYMYYKFKRLRVYVVPSAGTSEAGRVTLCPDYTLRGTLDSEAEINNVQGSRSGAIWESVAIDLDPNAMFPFGKYKKISQGVTSDQILADAAHLILAFSGVASGKAVSLWVDYSIDLFVPNLADIGNEISDHTVVPISNHTPSPSGAFIKLASVGQPLGNLNPYGVIESSDNLTLKAGVYEINVLMDVFIGTGEGTGIKQFECRPGTSSAERTAEQAPNFRWRSYDTLYHVSGTSTSQTMRFQLTYISDGSTPMAIWYKAPFSGNFTVLATSEIHIQSLN